MIRQNQPFVCRLRHLALSVGFRAKSAIFLAGTQKSCFSRCDEGALAVGELVSRTEKDSNA